MLSIPQLLTSLLSSFSLSPNSPFCSPGLFHLCIHAFIIYVYIYYTYTWFYESIYNLGTQMRDNTQYLSENDFNVLSMVISGCIYLPTNDVTSFFFWLTEIPDCPLYFHLSDTGENITCRDPVIGIGEPGKVIPKLCQFSKVSRSPGQIIGGIVTYKCVGSQWKEEKKGCISAPINSLLQLAKVSNLQPLTLSHWGGVSLWPRRILCT